MEVLARGEQFHEALQAKSRELEEANQQRAGLTQRNNALQAEISNLQQKAGDADLRLATSNFKVDELEHKVADLKNASNQALAEKESLNKDKTELLQ